MQLEKRLIPVIHADLIKRIVAVPFSFKPVYVSLEKLQSSHLVFIQLGKK